MMVMYGIGVSLLWNCAPYMASIQLWSQAAQPVVGHPSRCFWGRVYGW